MTMLRHVEQTEARENGLARLLVVDLYSFPETYAWKI
jgi:hypothetical protein